MDKRGAKTFFRLQILLFVCVVGQLVWIFLMLEESIENSFSDQQYSTKKPTLHSSFLRHMHRYQGKHLSTLGHKSHGSKEINVAIACAVTSKGMENDDLSKHHLIMDFLPSFCRTASLGFIYSFYISIDNDDFKLERINHVFLKASKQNQNCNERKILIKNVKVIQCNHNGHPAWAQNDAVMEAYIDEMNYFYRINDDTVLLTPDWTTKFVNILRSQDPSNVGVVGPTHCGGNTDILTYDFTSEKHIEIFGCHYPRVFANWYADDWITKVYKPNRSIKVNDVALYHLTDFQRYSIHGWLHLLRVKLSKLPKQIEKDLCVLRSYLDQTKHEIVAKNKKLAICFSLWKDDTNFLYGTLRNIQLASLFFPAWVVHIFIPRNIAPEKELYVRKNILKKMKSLGALIEYIDMKEIENVPIHLISSLIVDDESVTHFLIRDARYRLSECDVVAMDEFIISDKSFSFFQSPAKNKNKTFVFPEMWGGNRAKIKSFLEGNTMRNFIQETVRGEKDRNVQHPHFVETIWSKAKYGAHVHNSDEIASLLTKKHNSEERDCMMCPDFGQFFDHSGETINVRGKISEM